VVNFRGAIVPVLQIPAMKTSRSPRAGDGAVLIEVEGARAAICVDVVNSVSTLHDAEEGPGLADPAGGDNIPLLDPPALIADVVAATQAIAKETR
jgi:chemotaxis signal transduction protein